MLTTSEWVSKIVPLIDLTTLSNTETKDDILSLCSAAHTAVGNTAAVCIYSNYIGIAKDYFEAHSFSIPVATVANFPDGGDNLQLSSDQVRIAVEQGADEVDLVIPYTQFIAGETDICRQIVREASAICGEHTLLKVIIESGKLQTDDLIKFASDIAIEEGADFIKTSTGKVPINATIEAAAIMLQCIKDSGKTVGFKAAGGVSNLEQAIAYIECAEEIMGEGWVTPQTFRFGASSLLEALLKELEAEPT